MILNLLLPGITGLISFVIFVALLVAGVKSSNKGRVISSIAFLILFVGCFLWVAITGGDKVYRKGINALSTFYQPRTGEKIYSVLFGPSVTNCSKIINLTDQIVPRLDCCIWLEFQTCPAELRRIIALQNYTSTTFRSGDLDQHLPGYSPRPDWWKPAKLNSTITLLQSYKPENPNRDKILIFAADSTHVYYCDMAD